MVSQHEFIGLLVRHQNELHRYILAMVPDADHAADVIQETAMALWDNMAQYDPQRPFVAWALRFALIEVKRFRRRDWRWNRFLSDEITTLLWERRIDLAPELDARLDRLPHCLQALPDPAREVITQYYFQQQSVEQIAAQMGRSVAALYKLLQRARARLLDCVQQA